MNPQSTNQSAYKNFIKEKHERLFNTPIELINRAVEQATGTPIQTKERIIKGELNEVYSVKTTQGQEIIVRISHGDKPLFEFEKQIIDKCRAVGVPVPEILLVDTFMVGDKQHAISIQSKLAGVPFLELEHVSESESKNITRQAGEILSKIHSIPIHGFGALDEQGNGQYATMKDFLLNAFDEDKMSHVAQSVGIDQSVMNRALEVIHQGALLYPETTPCLIHNDYGPKHILVHNGRITGIIDFEIARSGDPVREFARWAYFNSEDGRNAYMDSFKEGYANKSIFSDTFDGRFRVWMMYLILVHLNYFIQDQNHIGIEIVKKELEQEMAMFYSNQGSF